MVRWFLVIALVSVSFGGATSAWAVYGNENELLNPCFENGGESWEYSDNVMFGAKYERPHTAYDPAGFGESGYLRQIVDDSLFPGWNPNWNRKIGELTFSLYTTGPAYVKVGFDWWDRLEGPKPVGFNAPDYHWVILPTEFRSVDHWSTITIPFDWGGQAGNNQPRWVSIEFYFYGCTGGYEAAVDDTGFKAWCVPEPSSLIMLSVALSAVAGLTVRRRRH